MEKFKTSKKIFYLSSVFSVLSLIIYVFICINSKFQDGIVWNILYIVFFVIFPTLTTLMMAKISFFDVLIDEKGVSKYRFNKLLLNITWEEINDVQIYNPICPWIVFSKESLEGIDIDKARLFMNTITLLYTKEVDNAVFKHCQNEKLLEKINSFFEEN